MSRLTGLTSASRLTIRCPGDAGMCSIIRRDEFDHWLVQAARERGAEIGEGEKYSKLIVIPMVL